MAYDPRYLEIWNRLTATEIAIVIGQGGELPPGAWRRFMRRAEAIDLMKREQTMETPRRIEPETRKAG